MSFQYVRFLKPNVVTSDDATLIHSVFARFEFIDVKTVPGGLTLVIVKDASGKILRAPKMHMAVYPSIIQITREIDGYDSCSTFDVIQNESWPSGYIVAKDPQSGQIINVPCDSVDAAAFHLHQKVPVAV